MPSPGHSLLVVDDDPDTRAVLRELFEAEGYAVATASNGRDALSLLEHEPRPCAILLDLMMPVMDGWEFLRLRSDDERLSRIPVIVISAYRERGQGQGVVAVVGKPIAFDTLITTVQQHCCARSRS